MFGSLLPDIPTVQMWVYLALSGVIGLTICDQALFSAFLAIGPRKALLYMTTSPIFAALFGFFVLKRKARASLGARHRHHSRRHRLGCARTTRLEAIQSRNGQ